MNIIEDQIKSKGISLRTLHKLLIIFAVVVSAVMILSTFHFSKKSSMLALRQLVINFLFKILIKPSSGTSIYSIFLLYLITFNGFTNALKTEGDKVSSKSFSILSSISSQLLLILSYILLTVIL